MQIALCFSFVLIGNAFQVKKACKILHLQGVMIRAAEPERRSRTFCLEPEPELRLKFKRSRSSDWNLRPGDGAMAIWKAAPRPFLDTNGFAKLTES